MSKLRKYRRRKISRRKLVFLVLTVFVGLVTITGITIALVVDSIDAVAPLLGIYGPLTALFLWLLLKKEKTY